MFAHLADAIHRDQGQYKYSHSLLHETPRLSVGCSAASPILFPKADVVTNELFAFYNERNQRVSLLLPLSVSVSVSRHWPVLFAFRSPSTTV